MGHIETVGIRFTLGGAFAVFGLPMHELVDMDVLADALAPDELSQLHEHIYRTSSLPERVARVEAWLRHHLSQRGAWSPVVTASLETIAETQGRISIQTVADQVHISARQLERLYHTQVGMSPKQFARIVRVRNTRAYLKQRGNQAVAEVAYAAGFYDQAHLNREFKAVVGMTPMAYISRRHHE